MTFDEAVIKSIREFYKGKGFDKYNEASEKPFMYTKEYFDEFEEVELGESPEVEEIETEEEMSEEDDMMGSMAIGF